MQTKTTFQFLGAMLVSVILTGCGGDGSGSSLDNALNGGGSNASSSAVGADTLQSIEFKDAVPATINLKGTGGAESALVRFRTVGQTGQPIQNVTVNFSLTSTVGGLGLSQTSAVSDKDGYVSTSVNSGNISTSIRVTATAKDNASISTQSNQLVIATGLPDQKSMSLALETFNPAGWGHNGITSNVNILLADAYNNPTADGTVVYFTTEGGSITASCTTVAGGCSVSWKSQDPRPTRNSADNSINRILCLGLSGIALYTCQAERAGRSTILATAIGNESFKDQNGNGIFDPGVDLFLTNPTDPADPLHNKCTPNVPYSSFESLTFGCDDLPEAYLDTNENGIHDAGEFFNNFITDTSHDATKDNYSSNNGLYNGAFCQATDETKGYCSRSPVTIRKEHMVVMSCDTLLLNSDGSLPKLPISTKYPTNGYAIADCNGNALPIDSTITIGSNTITIGNEYDWKPIFADPDTEVKVSVKAGGGSSDSTFIVK